MSRITSSIINFAAANEEKGENQTDSTRASKLGWDPEVPKRFSSISANFDLEKQNSVKSYRASKKSFSESSGTCKEECKVISSKLWSTIRSWKLRDLYVEMLCILFPSAEARQKPDSRSLIQFLQQIFKIDHEEHILAVEMTNQVTRAGEWVLNIEVIEAKGLPPMDVNGFSDPFCTLSLSTRKDLSYRTTVQNKTLQPIWNAMFTFPVTSYENDVVVINVWDYDPEETKMDKFKRISVIKSAKAWKQYWRDLTAGNETQEFMGKVTVDIKNVQPEVVDKWYPLENELNQGEIRLRMALGTNNDKLAAIHQYRQIYQLLLIYDLERSGVNGMIPFAWRGVFPNDNWTNYILQRMLWNGGLKPYQIHIAQWLALTRVHLEFPLDISLFSNLLEKIFHSLEKNSLFIKSDEYTNVWKSLNVMMQNFTRYISKDFFVDDGNEKNIKLMLETASQVRVFVTKPQNREYINKCLTEDNLIDQFKNAVTQRAVNIFEDSAKSKSETADTISSLAALCTLLQSDLDDSVRKFQYHFQKYLGLNFFDLTYKVYDAKIARLVQPIVDQACLILNEIGSIDLGNEEETVENNELYINMSISLFKLHVSVKRFSKMSSKLESNGDLCMFGSYHIWFRPCVFHWWECVAKNMTQCLKRSLESDKMCAEQKYADSKVLKIPISSFISESSQVFDEVQIIWKELDMPSNEEAYDLVLDIATKLCTCTLQYAQTISTEIDVSFIRNKASESPERYAIPKTVCIAVNNIQHVSEVGLGAVMKWMKHQPRVSGMGSENQSTKPSSDAAQKIADLSEQLLQQINEQISKIFEKCAPNIRAEMFGLVEETCCGTKEVQSGENEYIWYSDINLSILKYDLTPSSFNVILGVWWRENLSVIQDLTQLGINKQKEPDYFKRLHEIFLIMKNLFRGDRAGSNYSTTNTNQKWKQLQHTVEKEVEIDNLLRSMYSSLR